MAAANSLRRVLWGMRSIDAHEPSLWNLLRQSFTVGNRLPGIVDTPQHARRSDDCAMAVNECHGVVVLRALALRIKLILPSSSL